ncbi:MAG: malonyl CoA-acyl carrier protein transacylase, partial [Verrucomicrobia bacterium]
CLKRLIDLGCNYFIELGPGSVLAALLRRAGKEVDVISVGAVESVRECAARM